MIRFVHVFNYSAGVSRSDGEKWYLGTHVPAVKKLPGMRRYGIIGRGSRSGFPIPALARPLPSISSCAEPNCTSTITTYGGTRTGATPVCGRPRANARPDLGRSSACSWTKSRSSICCATHQQQYKYMTLPLWWPKGRPEVDEDAEIFIDSYCLLYPPTISLTIGEDWYLGHHTREGKQLPGMKHYKTWRTIRVPQEQARCFSRTNGRGLPSWG